jgi:hypothetical protein
VAQHWQPLHNQADSCVARKADGHTQFALQAAVPAAIQAMPQHKLQLALVKSIGSLKAKDGTIEMLKAQLKSASAALAEENAPPLPPSTSAGTSPASSLELHKAVRDAQHRAEAAEARAAAADAETATLVRASKDAAERSEAQIQDMAGELAALKRTAAEYNDAKV